jgi:hypothetical protein
MDRTSLIADCNFGQLKIKNSRVKIVNRNFKITDCKFGQSSQKITAQELRTTILKLQTAIDPQNLNLPISLASSSPSHPFNTVGLLSSLYLSFISSCYITHLRTMLDLSLGGIQNLHVSA